MTYLLNTLIPHLYLDSVMLMELSVVIESQADVCRAMALMASKPNLDLLEEQGLLEPTWEKNAQDGVILAVEAHSETAAQAAAEAGKDLIQEKKEARRAAPGAASNAVGTASSPGIASWREAPADASIAVISVPGEYAAAESWKALKAGRHVVLFSNQVRIEEEAQLKRAARERGLLLLGAECGTAILNGIPLGFANLARRGSIGIVAASGSGLQEVVCLIDRWGGGITHAIGTGGRDLSVKVGGLAMRSGLELLAEDAETRVIVLLSKPPDPGIAEEILTLVSKIDKPTVVCFLGLSGDLPQKKNIYPASTLEETARKAVLLSGLNPGLTGDEANPTETAAANKANQYVRGLYSGGTLAYEAMLILGDILGPIYSNAPIDAAYRLEKGHFPAENVILDLGTEEYTSGVPHPMIDGRIRNEFIAAAGADPTVRVILLDVILGLGSDANPAAAISPGICAALDAAKKAGRDLAVVASVTGTQRDPQGYQEQVLSLQSLGVEVCHSNAAAARRAAQRILTSTITLEN